MTTPEQLIQDLIAWYTTREAYSVPELGFYSASNMPNNREVQQDFRELQAYLEVLQRLPSRNLSLEIGFHRGGTHFVWSRIFGEVISVDINYWACCKGKVEFPSSSSKIVCGDSRHAVTVQTVSGILDGRKVDHLFIDGDHEYTAVLSDFLGYAPFVREGGIVGFHDSQWKMGGVPTFLNDLRSGLVRGWRPTAIEDIHFSQGDYAMGISYFCKQGQSQQ